MFFCCFCHVSTSMKEVVDLIMKTPKTSMAKEKNISTV
jgi:hypothetical protein